MKVNHDMSDLNEKIEVVQLWINNLQQDPTTDPLKLNTTEIVLGEIVNLIQQGDTKMDISDTYADLEQQVQKQTIALTEATNALKSQVTERESASRKLRTAYNNLETHLQEHIAYHSKLNQRLLEQIEEQKRNTEIEQEERALTEALRDTLATMSSTLDLDKILDHILDTVKRVTPYDGANILFVETDLVQVVRQRGYVEKELEKEWLNQRIPITKLTVLQQMIDLGKPQANSVIDTSPLWIGFPDSDWIQSNVIAPIRSNGTILGFLSLDSAIPGYFTQIHAERLQSFADQAAIAIQNARLLDRAKRAAVMAERSRMANELHDTISQTLWSMSLITERLPAMWELDREAGQRSLMILHQLGQSALAEMRSLLLELRPSKITDEKLGDLIRQLATTISHRNDLKVSVQIDNQERVSPDVHFAFYRIVQEALNNVVLHASASEVEIYFKSYGGRIDLSIHDNGSGFNPDNVGIGHLGLSIMKDRIQKIGGRIETISGKGDGTLIIATWDDSSNADLLQ